jgi:hypothetical protein
MTDNTPRILNSSPSKKVNPEHTLKTFKKEDHDEHAPDSVRDSEMHSEMVDLSHRKESGAKMIEEEPVDFGIFPGAETKGREATNCVDNDFAPKEEKGDDDGSDEQRQDAIDFYGGGAKKRPKFEFDDSEDELKDDAAKNFQDLRVKVGLSWKDITIKT